MGGGAALAHLDVATPGVVDFAAVDFAAVDFAGFTDAAVVDFDAVADVDFDAVADVDFDAVADVDFDAVADVDFDGAADVDLEDVVVDLFGCTTPLGSSLPRLFPSFIAILLLDFDDFEEDDALVVVDDDCGAGAGGSSLDVVDEGAATGAFVEPAEVDDGTAAVGFEEMVDDDEDAAPAGALSLRRITGFNGFVLVVSTATLLVLVGDAFEAEAAAAGASAAVFLVDSLTLILAFLGFGAAIAAATVAAAVPPPPPPGGGALVVAFNGSCFPDDAAALAAVGSCLPTLSLMIGLDPVEDVDAADFPLSADLRSFLKYLIMSLAILAIHLVSRTPWYLFAFSNVASMSVHTSGRLLYTPPSKFWVTVCKSRGLATMSKYPGTCARSNGVKNR